MSQLSQLTNTANSLSSFICHQAGLWKSRPGLAFLCSRKRNKVMRHQQSLEKPPGLAFLCSSPVFCERMATRRVAIRSQKTGEEQSDEQSQGMRQHKLDRLKGICPVACLNCPKLSSLHPLLLLLCSIMDSLDSEWPPLKLWPLPPKTPSQMSHVSNVPSRTPEKPTAFSLSSRPGTPLLHGILLSIQPTSALPIHRPQRQQAEEKVRNAPFQT